MISKLLVQEIKTDDCKILRLADNSLYNPALPVTNAILEITPPGYDCPVIFNVQKYFNTAFNSTLLTLTSSLEESQLVALPDGVYTIKYSIKPNNSLFVEYDLMRTCQATYSYINEICRLFDSRCDISRKTFEMKLQKLRWIRELLDVSKYMVEDKGKRKEGLDLYNEAVKALRDYSGIKCY